MNYKKTLQILEHVALIAIVAGTLGFYFGNQYGHSQVNISKLTQASQSK